MTSPRTTSGIPVPIRFRTAEEVGTTIPIPKELLSPEAQKAILDAVRWYGPRYTKTIKHPRGKLWKDLDRDTTD